ncbi:MAG TPA: APC family permease, partial [Longilinea sp.]|nr:APC family permease [Longilinea sp.]
INPTRMLEKILIGKRLATADSAHQTIGKIVGLAVFSSDALSSVAYGPQELMMVLVAAGMGALSVSIPLVFGIVALLLLLTFSYRQTIHAYPGGGGAYIVARDNLGELPAQTAGAALLTDYILTVAVSISSGVAQITSAYPNLYGYRVWISVGMILFIMLINLRGVKESGITFAIPTYFFLAMILLMSVIGFVQYFTGNLGTVINPPTLEIGMAQPLAIFLILRAFANGTTSLTGVEAISNGITAFKEPRSKNAATTLLWMAGILGFLLLSMTFLAHLTRAVPVESETIVSQVARTVFGGRSLLYLLLISSTTIILMMAANTAYADFPRLGALHAGDGFLPRQLTTRGSRLVFSRGIITLAVISSLLVIIFQASVTKLIPLYAIGVFLSFSLSQAGMARRWWKSGHLKPGEKIVEPGSTVEFESGWQYKMLLNGLGAFCTFVVMVIFAITKFRDGAWVVVILTPVLVAIFFSIHHHYKHLAKQLSLENHLPRRSINRNRVIIPIASVHRGSLEAIRYAKTLSDDITAVHINLDPKDKEKIESKWQTWGEGIRLVMLNSPYRLFIEPFVEYVERLDGSCKQDEMITIIVPQFIPKHWWERFLHARTAEALRKVLLNRKDIVITEVPYQLD